MTRDDHRAECIEAMCKARYESDCVFARWEEESEDFKENYRRKETFAFDSLHGIALVCHPEEMIIGGKRYWRAGHDLTNPQEQKP
jgi:hypothetical protein